MKEEYIIDKEGKKRKATKVVCDFCGKSFLKPTRFIKRHAHNYCSKECAFKSRENRITVKCANCSKEFNITPKRFTLSKSGLYFCCIKCKNNYGMFESTKEKLSIINTKCSIENYNKNPKICPICGNIIPYNLRDNKTCSKKCSKRLAVIHSTYENCGGYREGCYGRGKQGWYKGYFCGSTFELAYLIYCLDHNIDIKRCTESFEYELDGKKHKYYPDFVVNGVITEIKGWDKGDVSAKMKSVGNKPYKLLYYKDIDYMFDYVAEKYNKHHCGKNNNFYELYENK